MYSFCPGYESSHLVLYRNLYVFVSKLKVFVELQVVVWDVALLVQNFGVERFKNLLQLVNASYPTRSASGAADDCNWLVFPGISFHTGDPVNRILEGTR